MKKNFVFFTTLYSLLFNSSFIFAQSDSLLSVISDLSENETDLAELLLDLQQNPVNINDAAKDELLAIPLLTEEITDSIIAIRERRGPYHSKRQIRSITGPEIYDLIKNYISTSQKKKYVFHLTHRDIYNIETIAEIRSGVYAGNVLNDYTRLKYLVAPHVIVGLVTQKDAGEKNYIDHFNFSLQYKTTVWNIILGNFYLQMAEGLSQDNPYGSQKSIYPAAAFRETVQFARSNLTSAESSGKFGLFIQNNIASWLTLFSFYSNANRDARLTDNIISGFKFDGLHRSQNEIEAHNRFREAHWGAGIRYIFLKSISLTTFFSQYRLSKKIDASASVVGENQKRRQYFNFSGSDLKQAVVALSWQFNHFKSSAELSASDKGQPGLAQSFYFSKDKIHLGFRYWYLNKNFQSVDGRVFDDSNPFPQGIKGFFSTIRIKLDEHNTFAAYKIQQQGLWRSYFNPMPIQKDEWLSQWEWKSKKTQFISRWRSKISEDFLNTDQQVVRVKNKQNYIRLQMSYSPHKYLSGRTRWEHNYMKGSYEKGTLILQELTYNFNSRITFTSRFTFFKTTSFVSRLYEFERDVPGAFSNVALFGSGNKFYALIKWKMTENFSFWLKWRYLSKDKFLTTGQNNKILSRDIRLQIQTAY
jgi:Helix-hairpin-helix motif